MSLRNLKFEVFGIVQGVNFRACTKSYADSIGVKGWVQNTVRSTVIGEGEGSENQISEFKHWLTNTGSPLCTISDSKFEETPISERKYHSFTIKH